MKKIKKKTKKKNRFDFNKIINSLAFVLLVIVVALVFVEYGNTNIIKNVSKKSEKTDVKVVNNIQTTKEEPKEEKVPQIQFPYGKYSFNYVYTINVVGKANEVNFKVAVPKNESEKQYISQLNIQPQPIRTYNDGVNNIAEFKIPNVSTGKIDIKISGIAQQRTYDYDIAQKINKNSNPELDLSMYLKPAKYIESDDPLIVKTASTLKGQTQKETVENTFNFVQKNLNYTTNVKLMGAKDVIRLKKGRCMDYSHLMIALLRANNIPARYVVGYMIKEGNNYHAWVEVYYKDYGWVVYDPTLIDIPLYYTDATGQTHKKTAIIEPSSSLGRRYIASARNMKSAYNVSMRFSGNSRPSMSLTEKTIIQEIQ